MSDTQERRLYRWSARRAGGRITVTHSTGKVAGIDKIEPKDGFIVATDKNGVTYVLAPR